MSSSEMIKNPHVFISYSWTSPEHEEWVVNLARRLMENGVSVKLDKWDLKPGHDVFAFMESMVNSEEIDKVLIICDREYAVKANNRTGGVGAETQIITPEVYSNQNQEKFVPIVAERDENGNHFIPTYIKNRVYIDLSSEDYFEEEFEKLLRTLFNRPQYKKPALGKPPEWLFSDEIPHYKTSNINRQIEDSIVRNPKRIKGLISRFSDEFFESLEQFQIKNFENKEIDDIIVDHIERMIPLRNDYIQFLELICEAYEIVDSEFIIEFFERLYSFAEPTNFNSRYHVWQWDQYKFLIHELFLYTAMILLSQKQYFCLAGILNSEYITSGDPRYGRRYFSDFRFHLESLESRNNRLNLRRVNLQADLIINRCTRKYPKNFMSSTDILIYYLSCLSKNINIQRWFPITYIYNKDTIKFLVRLKSRSHFEKCKCLFGVNSPEELKEAVSEFNNEYAKGYGLMYGGIPDIKYFINPNDICTMP